MDLISRKSVAEKMARRRDYVGRPSCPDCIIADEPSVPAVPLDKLCEWMSENSIIIPYESCPNFSNDYCAAIRNTSIPCPKTADDWRRAITKWMEEQDGNE